MPNSTKGIITAADIMIICHLDHPNGHIASISSDIMVPLRGHTVL